MIYSDYNHKHVFSYLNKVWYPYTMPWELNWGEQINQLYAWNWHFKKFLTKKLGVLKGGFWEFGCTNDTPMPCWLRLYLWFISLYLSLWWLILAFTGMRKGERIQSQPYHVTALYHKDVHIQQVVCSDAATVCATTSGDVYTLHDYQCRKIVSK